MGVISGRGWMAGRFVLTSLLCQLLLTLLSQQPSFNECPCNPGCEYSERGQTCGNGCSSGRNTMGIRVCRCDSEKALADGSTRNQGWESAGGGCGMRDA